MTAVLTLARLQIMENIRRQVHLITLFFGILLLMLPAFVNTFSMGLNGFELVAKDFGLTLIGYYGLIMAIFQGSTVIPTDIERKTIYPILSRPVSRLDYILGQFLGIVVLLFASMLVLGICLTVSVGTLAQHFEWRMLLAVYGSYLECLLVAAVCLCFSTLASPPLAGVIGVFIYLVGGLSDVFIKFFIMGDRSAPAVAWLAEHLRDLLPRFGMFHLKLAVVHDFPIDSGFLGALTLYGASWMVLFLLLAALAFSRRDL